MISFSDLMLIGSDSSVITVNVFSHAIVVFICTVYIFKRQWLIQQSRAGRKGTIHPKITNTYINSTLYLEKICQRNQRNSRFFSSEFMKSWWETPRKLFKPRRMMFRSPKYSKTINIETLRKLKKKQNNFYCWIIVKKVEGRFFVSVCVCVDEWDDQDVWAVYTSTPGKQQ